MMLLKIILSLTLPVLLYGQQQQANPINTTMAGIIDTCYYYLTLHECTGSKWDLNFHFYRPSLEKYSPDQWLWDSGSHMITWTHRNVTNSILDMRTMLQMQQPTGFIPEEIFWSKKTFKENAEIKLQYSNDKYTDITQMPVLPYSLKAMSKAIDDVNTKNTVIKEFLYPLINYFKWWRQERDMGDGLVVIIHNWESGLDASPAYDPAFHVYITDVNDTSFHQLYPKFIELAESYKLLYNWDIQKILDRTKSRSKHLDRWFVVKDIGLNCVYASGWKVLADMALEIGDVDTANECIAQYKISRDAIINKMFISSQGHFNSLYIDNDGKEKNSVANTIQNLFPLLLYDLPANYVDIIVADLSNDKKFMSPYSIPTVAMDDPQFSATFDADLMWRGPVWGYTNWFVLEGLGLHNEMTLQKTILDSWIALVQKSGIYEHYNPIDGTPYGAVGLGMSTLVCDWIYRCGYDKN